MESLFPQAVLRAATSLVADCVGDAACFYCGSPANVPLRLSSSYVEWWSVATPESGMICRGCEWMINEKRPIPGKEKLQKTRNYSWLIEEGRQTPLTKANKSAIGTLLLSPPEPPWALALADSGQKHLLFRTPVNASKRAPHAVQLEVDTIVYSPDGLQERMSLARKVVAAVGHKNATEVSAGMAIAAGFEVIEQWEQVIGEPLTRLALFVTPSQKECQEC